MEFITVEQFKEQPKEVQKVFLDWYRFDKYDLFYMEWEGTTEKLISGIYTYEVVNSYLKHLGRLGIKPDVLPLFTEGQLRKFIEDKIGGILDVECSDILDGYKVYDITVFGVKGLGFECISFERYVNAENLLQAYWEVACMIAKEEVDG